MIDHPLTEAHVKKLWERHRTEAIDGWLWLSENHRAVLAGMVRDAYDAGREDALTPLDPLADLTPGTVIRDVTIKGHETVCGGFILADARGHVVATTHGYYFLSWITAFTTDDRTIRYIRHGDTWTAENLNGETND